MDENSKIVLIVNNEEKYKLLNFLKDQNMTSCIVEKRFMKRKAKPIEKDNQRDNNDNADKDDNGRRGDNGGRDDNGDNGGSEDPEPESEELSPGQCPYCFINPCIATSNNSAPWLGHGQPPSHANPQIRKGIYRRFWKCINNMYGWLLTPYLNKKRRIGGGEWVVMHQREIMPECVLDLVRGLYPNPDGIPYVGHTWE